MTDPREALERLTRWRDGGGYYIKQGCAARGERFTDDVKALLSLVEKQQDVLRRMVDIYGDMQDGNGDTPPEIIDARVLVLPPPPESSR